LDDWHCVGCRWWIVSTLGEYYDFAITSLGVLVKDIDKSAFDYVSKFGYELRSPVIHDPVQTALVQFLRLEGDGTYVELISPDGLESKLVTALKKFGGLNIFFQ
jgi:hypothetical protein